MCLLSLSSLSFASTAYLVGIRDKGGMGARLQTRTTLTSPWIDVSPDYDLRAVTVMPDGRILGAFSNQDLMDPWFHTFSIKDSLGSRWKTVSTSPHPFIHSLAVMKNGTIIGVGTDAYQGGGIGSNYELWTKATLTSPWVVVPGSGAVISVSVMPDGRILGVCESYGLWVREILTSPWVAVPNSGNVIAVAAMSDGSIIGVGESKGLWRRENLTSPWKAIQNSGEIDVITDGKNINIPDDYCRNEITPTSSFHPAEGGQFSFTVTDANNCGWSLSEDVSWLRIISYPYGSGTKNIIYDVDRNYSINNRSGKLTIECFNTTLEYTVTQEKRETVNIQPAAYLLLNNND